MENIKEEINELIKRKKFIDRLLFPGYILWCLIVIFSYKYVDMFIMVIGNMFNIDNLLIILLEKINDFVGLYSPYLLYIGCRIEGNKVTKDIKRLHFEYQIALENERKMKENEECKIVDYDEIIKLYNIVERVANLPRNKQMEILNYIKGDLSLRDNNIYSDIDKLDSKYREQLQTECEDIIFPDYCDDIDVYTKKRKK